MSTPVPTAWWVRLPIALALALAALVAPATTGAAHAATVELGVIAYESGSGVTVPDALIEVFAVDPAADPGATPMATGTTELASYATVSTEDVDRWVRVSRFGYLPEVQFVPADSGPAFSVQFSLVIDPALAGTISGRVLDEDGAPFDAGRASVSIYQTAGQEDVGRGVVIDGSGNYELTVAPGDYRVKLRVDHGERPDVWVGGTSFETARVFSVPASGSLTVPTTTVPIGPKVTGVVTDEAGQPINRTLVAIYRSDNEMSYQSWTHTNARGAYTFASLQPGTYKLVFGDELGHYVGE